jgi:hypothetical protein
MNALTITPAKNTAKGQYADKETVKAWSVVAMKPTGDLAEIITLRWYRGRSNSANTIYCNLWLRVGTMNSGHGAAGGGGYCKHSAAFDQAMRNAGIEYPQDVDGRGLSAVRKALNDIAETMGFYGSLVVEHG